MSYRWTGSLGQALSIGWVAVGGHETLSTTEPTVANPAAACALLGYDRALCRISRLQISISLESLLSYWGSNFSEIPVH